MHPKFTPFYDLDLEIAILKQTSQWAKRSSVMKVREVSTFRYHLHI